MASLKYKGFFRKKLNSKLGRVASSLRKENAYLRKTVTKMSHQYSEYNKRIETFLSFKTILLESYLRAGVEKIALLLEQLSPEEGNQIDKASTADECTSTYLPELLNHLNDALEKTERWLEYERQREAYDGEKQLHEDNQAPSEQHIEGPTANELEEREQVSRMADDYELPLQSAQDKQEVLTEQVDTTHQNPITKSRREQSQNEEELQLQLHSKTMCRESAAEDEHSSEDEEQRLRQETKDLQCRLKKERHRSARCELQAYIFQKFMLNCHLADQEKIRDLERQIQDLQDERENCAYLKEKPARLLKMLQNNKDGVRKEPKRDQPDCSSSAFAHPSTVTFRADPTSSPHRNTMEESFLECPVCQAVFPVSYYQQLLNHIDICQG